MPNKYVVCAMQIKGVKIRRCMHVLVYEAFRGPVPKGKDVDHRNRIRNTNSLGNLRLATRSQNNINSCSPKVKRRGAVIGVSPWRNGRWRASITVNRRSIHLGIFDTHEEAVSVRATAEKKYFGRFAPKRDTVYLSELPDIRIKRINRYPGTRRHKKNGSWYAFTTVGDKQIHLGAFPTQRKAFRARLSFITSKL